MICYRDMCFCPFYTDCANASHCSRPLTDEVREGAKRVGAPIDQFVERPDCHSPVDDQESRNVSK